MKLILVVLLCLLGALVRGSNHAPKVLGLSDLQNMGIATQLLDNVDAAILLFDDKEVNTERILETVQQIETRTLFSLVSEGGGRTLLFAPETRALAVQQVLSPARYSALEKACIAHLSSTNKAVSILSMRILSQSLGSDAGKPYMRRLLKEEMEKLTRDDEIDVSPDVFFAVAENLAYLKDASGIEVLESALRSGGSSPSLKQRAIQAVNYLGVSVPDRIKSDLLLSDDAMVAYTAFDSIGSAPTNSVVLSSAIRQLQNLEKIYTDTKTLTINQRTLLLEVASVIKNASRQGGLSRGLYGDVKKTIVFLASAQDEDIQARVGSLFAELANDGDGDLIARLLISDSARVRSRAALALARCSKQTIHSQKDVLLSLLDDTSAEVRNFSLYALRKGLGERTGNYLSEKEYEVQRVRVREAYDDPNSEN